jgi:hypothetical protein
MFDVSLYIDTGQMDMEYPSDGYGRFTAKNIINKASRITIKSSEYPTVTLSATFFAGRCYDYDVRFGSRAFFVSISSRTPINFELLEELKWKIISGVKIKDLRKQYDLIISYEI